MQVVDSVLLIAEAPSTQPLVDLLTLLSHQRLLRPLAVAVGDREFLVIEEGTHREVDLTEILQQPINQFRLLHLVAADGAGDAPRTSVRAVDVERTMRNALAVRDGLALQELIALNVVAPAPVAHSLPTDLYIDGDLGKWVNIVLMPEDQRRSDLAVVEVALDHAYVAHVGCALATVGGLWFGGEVAPAVLRANTEPPCWHLVRTRSRTLAAPEVPDLVVGQVARGRNPFPTESGRRFDPLSTDDVERLVDNCFDTLVVQHHLVARHPVPPEQPSARRIGIRQLLGLIRDFVTFGLGRRIRAEFEARRRELVDFAERQLNTAVGTEGLDFRIGLGRAPTVNELVEQGPDVERLSSGTVVAEPALWEQLRSTAFGLLDGGPLPAGPESMVSLGSTRLVVTERSSVVSSEVEAVGDQRAADDPPRPLVDRICWSLDRETASALEIVHDIEQRLDDLQAAYAEELERARRPWWRRAATWAWRALKVLFVVAAAGALVFFVPVLLPVAGVFLAAWFVLGGAVLVIGALGVVARMAWLWFREAHALRDGSPEIVFLTEALAIAKLQLSRFGSLAAISADWFRVIQVLVHEPFGPPLINRRPRVRNAELHLPQAHAMREASMSDLRKEGVCGTVRRSIYRAGWLTALFAGAADLSRREFELRQPVLSFDPDGDRTTDAHDTAGSRGTLRAAVAHGRARSEGRIRLATEVHHILASGDGVALEGPVVDWLFSDLDDHGQPSEFIAEAFVGEPAAWNRGSIIVPAGAKRPSDVVKRLEEHEDDDLALPELPDVEGLLAGATVEFRPFMFRSWCLEGAVNVPQGDLTFFADEPVFAVIDVSSAATMWKIPDEVDRGDVEPIDESERVGWGILEQDLPEHGRRITPLSPPVVPPALGPFTFIVEVDGVPARVGVEVMPFRIRCAGAPRTGVQIALHCLQLAADATGLTFEFVGALDRLPARGDEFEGLDVAWAFDDEYREYERQCGMQPGSSIGLGGPRTRTYADGSVRVVGGTAVLNSEMAATTEITGRVSHAMVLLHELGHALNLGHVNALDEVMYTSAHADGLDMWGPGDRSGLLKVVSVPSMVGS